MDLDALFEDHSRELIYLVDHERVLQEGDFVVQLWRREQRGPRAHARPFKLSPESVRALRHPWDQRICSVLADPDEDGFWELDEHRGDLPNELVLPPDARDKVLPLLLSAGELFYRERQRLERPMRLDPDLGSPWRFLLSVGLEEDGAHWQVGGCLVRGCQQLGPDEPWLLMAGGWVIWDLRIAPMEDHGAFHWLHFLRRQGPLRVPRGQEQELVERLWKLPRRLPVLWPEELKLQELRFEPRPCLRIERSRGDPRVPPRLRARLRFLYDDRLVEYEAPENAIPEPAARRLIVRDAATEDAFRQVLMTQGLRAPPGELVRELVFHPLDLELLPEELPPVVRNLTADGWQVEAEGKRYRKSSRFHLHVTSGTDWFNLEVDARFGEQTVPLPKLLEAVRRGSGYVRLGDGTFGILPETWLNQYYFLLAAGRLEGGVLRFQRSQLAILESIVAQSGDVSWDAVFDKVRSELRAFDRLVPEDPSGSFLGELRPYQKEGLSWLGFLGRLGLGGCLADDMGLGKTVQVLALAEGRRHGGSPGRPSLVVAPRSLVFNWMAEVGKFAPELRVLRHAGTNRLKDRGHLEGFNLVVTTYGTLVRDIDFLEQVRFDYAILDEAQAIKNPSSTYARAARRLRADHRLALSGTPIENHLGELWSLFEFLNPGMLGSAAAFKRFAAGADEEAALQPLSRLLRPLILRRTKGQVARDLPERVEQTIYCELEPEHRRQYDELRDYYRTSLLEGDDPEDLGRSRIKVLDALLRLRQAACHPGLLDRHRAGERSGKLETLLEQLAEVQEEGNKALVFSQFTSLLAILRQRLEARGSAYEYLDGRTHDRAARVARFQTDPDCRLFLVSLKAGGLGLNLTAAEYVFLLDPWWNPAVEAQAIDRAHRIGQRRKVFAYRLLARDTVEDKILELQERKRRLAMGILAGAMSALRDLEREDLELLLS
ncbi:MAG: DEAD/DEAH box helicase [Planctomycetes bacterium]|nr:DEAD/DEAH box helicase [Planctomycetota bacterium]